ncbi:AAA family ATPase [Adlercreutzia sp. R21]|uniref:AAA family ATPase n=1 Tax=Adlercreutzia wanghongyangiae TaxID=3111451 RepID=UPI002DB973FE|nr:AAA family ATPase [Adlercreutzia sp. R21]MEC4185097.1 AAA family ATPase [Adlercreutzia sp. R21]
MNVEKYRSYDFLGFGVRGYRSFTSAETALVGPFDKVHLITGQNNSGKSALADIANRILPTIQFGGAIGSRNHPFVDNDVPQNTPRRSDINITLSLCFSRSSILAKVEESRCRSAKTLEKMLSCETVSRGDDSVCWFDFDIPARAKTATSENLTLNEKFAGSISKECNSNFQDAALEISLSASSDPRDNLRVIIKQLAPWDAIPRPIKVEAIRCVTSEAETNKSEVSGGEGLTKKLRQLKMPTVEEQFVSREKWERFENFVRNILNDPAAEVTTDAEATAVLVKSGTPGFLELSNLGTGIEEIIMIAAVVACNNNKLIIIEEPEIHLHPTLQSKLIQYFLEDQNENRFLITTHSPAIINIPGVTVTQVSKSQGVSTTSQIKGIVDVRNALDDIGAKPSDLLQSNYVIWVEGPSDRIYVNYWLSTIAPELKEGTHYSIMIYGGKLLNACKASAPDSGNDLIALFRINTHFCVVMDSDRSNKGAKLNATKLRIKEECQSSGNISWITDGRTIENYVPPTVLRESLDKLYPTLTYDGNISDRYTCPLNGKFEGKQYGPDKIKIARAVAEQGHELSPELIKRVERLASHIKIANGL